MTPIGFVRASQTRVPARSFHRPDRDRKPSRMTTHPSERNLVRRFFNKIKHYRRIATRNEKTVVSFAATLFLVGAMIWLSGSAECQQELGLMPSGP
jgi:transposase